jgi:hypothetical protein
MSVMPLTGQDREDLEEKLADLWTDNADMQTLAEYFYNTQMEFLKDLDDNELLTYCDDNGIELPEYLIKGTK